MAFAQLAYRKSLRDIETCLRAQSARLYLGIRGAAAEVDTDNSECAKGILTVHRAN